MNWVVGTGIVVGLPAMTAGAIALRTGRTVPWLRRKVLRPRIHWLGALLVGTPSVVQGLFHFQVLPGPYWEIRFFGGNALLFSGLLLMGLGQALHPRNRVIEPHGNG
ncbi:hypothetical protein [Streptomyces sp. NPDC001070]